MEGFVIEESGRDEKMAERQYKLAKVNNSTTVKRPKCGRPIFAKILPFYA